MLVLASGCKDEACLDIFQMGPVTPAETTVAVGGSYTARATFYSCGQFKPGNYPVRWQSNNPAIASIDSTSGVVTGRAIGDAYVTATTVDPAGLVGPQAGLVHVR